MHRHPVLGPLGSLMGFVTVVVGWGSLGAATDSGRLLTLVAACVATVALLVFAWFARDGRAVPAGLALLLVCASPTAFAYPLNVVVLVLAVCLVVVGVSTRHTASGRTERTAARSSAARERRA